MEFELDRGYWKEIWKWLMDAEPIIEAMDTGGKTAFQELFEALDAEFSQEDVSDMSGS